jgi:hypothetical protein
MKDNAKFYFEAVLLKEEFILLKKKLGVFWGT